MNSDPPPSLDDSTPPTEEDSEKAQSKKTEAIEILFEKLCPSGEIGADRVIAVSDDIVASISQRNANYPRGAKKLSEKNPANFLKDLIRVYSCNANWPKSLTAKRITARQLYGKTQVLEFVPFGPNDTVPFPDRYDPTDDMPVLPFETLSLPLEARALGRQDEPWLIQVSVSQRVIHAHLAIHANPKKLHVETLAHLQTSVKTQPEIDATFIATIRDGKGKRTRAYVTVEAKQFRERILEHQIREQVATAFRFTKKLDGEDKIDAVLPMVLKVVDHKVDDKDERGIYVVQFEKIERNIFAEKYADPTRLYEMPLEVQSRSFFAPRPHVRGISRK